MDFSVNGSTPSCGIPVENGCVVERRSPSAPVRYRPFLNARHRFARATIENIDLTGFGGLNQDRNLFALVIFHMEQHRLRRQIIVPDIMVNGLEDPFVSPVLASTATTEEPYFSLASLRSPPQ
jgi:hypothetical protein